MIFRFIKLLGVVYISLNVLKIILVVEINVMYNFKAWSYLKELFNTLKASKIWAKMAIFEDFSFN